MLMKMPQLGLTTSIMHGVDDFNASSHFYSEGYTGGGCVTTLVFHSPHMWRLIHHLIFNHSGRSAQPRYIGISLTPSPANKTLKKKFHAFFAEVPAPG